MESRLIALYQAKMGPALRPYVEQAMRAWFKATEGGTSFSTLDDFRVVQSFAATLAETSPALTVSQPVDFSPEAFIRSSVRFQELRPELEALRHVVFGSDRVPFRSFDRALLFLKEHAVGYGELVSIQGQEFFMPPGSALGDLARETRRLDEESPFTQAALVGYVMVGVMPLGRTYRLRARAALPRMKRRPGSPPISLTVKAVGRLPLEVMDLRIYRPLADRELSALLREVRSRMRIGRKSFSPGALRLYRFMTEFGRPPATGKMGFWERAYAEFHRRNPRDPIRSAGSLRRAWIRLELALNAGVAPRP